MNVKITLAIFVAKVH